MSPHPAGLEVFVDVQAEPVTGDGLAGVDLTTTTALASLRENAAVKVSGAGAAEAEAKLRAALVARGMPGSQIDRMVEKAKARAEQAARELADIAEEMLAAAPGQAQ